jgi:histidinol-phosphatase (PHP family)
MSTDSEEEATAAISAAKKKGLGIIFTEHYDADFVGGPSDFRVNPDIYLKEYEKYKSDGVLTGIEIGLTHMSTEINKKLAASYPFDFVIGSVHMVGETDIYLDFVKSEKPCLTGEMYFDYVARMIEENDFIDALGHIDYPLRYIGAGADFSFETHSKKYDIIFENLISRNIPIELNSRRISGKEVYCEMLPIYKRYYDAGGRYVTFGSDAHKAENIGQNFKNAVSLAAQIGLKPVYFKGRKMYISSPSPA